MQPFPAAGYDKGISIFSPDGRLFQVEYAREAVKRGTTSLGVKSKEGIVLVVDKRPTSTLVEPKSIEKIFKIDEHIGAATSGLVANPVIGRLTDLIVGSGGISMFSETPEIVGAEHILAERTTNQKDRARILNLVKTLENNLKSIGEDLSLTRERIRQLEGRALEHARRRVFQTHQQ